MGAKDLAPTGIFFFFSHCTLSVPRCPVFRPLSLLYSQHNTNAHVPGGIRTRNASKQAAADPGLGQLGHWGRRIQSPDRPVSSESLY